MNMKTIIAISALVAASGVYATEIKSGGSETFNLLEQKQKTLHIEFDSSAKMTALLKQQMKDYGFTVVDSEDAADIKVKMMGVFTFQKPHAKKMVVNFGKVIESTDGSLLASKDAESLRVASINLNTFDPNLSLGVALGGGIVDTVLTMVSVKSWFNKLIAGDERGFCVGTQEMCKDWKKYTQEVRMAAVVSPRNGGEKIVRSYAATKEEQLQPNELYQLSMLELSERLTGSQSGQAPGEKVTTIPEPEGTASTQEVKNAQ